MLLDSPNYEASSDASSSNVLNSVSSITHAPDHVNTMDLREHGLLNKQTDDDIFSRFFIDPFKYHQLADEADAKNKVEDFMAY